MEKIIPLISAEEIAARVKEMAEVISKDYSDRDLMLIGVLKGGFVFMADLIRRLKIPISCDFVQCSSYADRTESSDKVGKIFGLSSNMEGKDVLLIEDVVDTGLSVKCLKDKILSKKPRSLKICCLLNKPAKRKFEIDLFYHTSKVCSRLRPGLQGTL